MKNKLIGILIIMLVIMLPINVFAYSGIDTNIAIGQTPAVNSSVDITNRIVGVLQVAGTIIAVIALIIIGMRYMLSSVQEKAQLKGVLGYYVIGALLVFATSNILAFAYSIVDDVRHNYEDAEIIYASTCVREGLQKRICKDCYHEIEVPIPINSNAHNWSGWSVTKTESCVENGTETSTCRNGCGKTESRTRSATGHKWENNKVIKEATCIEEGRKGDKCKNCGEEKNIEVIAAVGHNWENNKVIEEATCTEAGYKGDKCENCGEERNKQRIAPKGHSMETVTTDPTCTNKGLTQIKCKNCTYVESSSVIAAKGHTEVDISPKSATCTEKGYYGKQCSVCGTKTSITYTDPLGHSAGGVVWRRSNSNLTHTDMHSCTRCGCELEGSTYDCNMEFTGTKTDDPNSAWPLDFWYEHKCSWCGYTRWREHENSGDYK